MELDEKLVEFEEVSSLLEAVKEMDAVWSGVKYLFPNIELGILVVKLGEELCEKLCEKLKQTVAELQASFTQSAQ